jgi:molecular chaperone HtpG
MRNGQLSIHSENILPIIKKWLYSEKDIFVRELVSNAADAIQKLTILQAKGEASAPKEPRIDITIDKEKKTLTFSDTGLGLDEEEAETFLAQIAFSGAEEFLKTYQLNDTFIGHFGLGFFSVFMVADHVEVISRSYKLHKSPIIWKSDGSSSYTIDTSDRAEVGTDIILHLNRDQEEYLDESLLSSILQRFCSFFPASVYLHGKKINTHFPLWQKRPSECTDADYKSFYTTLYPLEEPPLFWVHINVDYPFHVQGVLYFPRIHKEIELSKDHVKLFCNRVFVSDNAKDILPEYLVLLRGVLDSPDIPLNVSRSHLQVDKTVQQLAQHISKKVADALTSLFKNERQRFEKCWDAYELVVKFGMLQDEKFYERVKDLLIWKTSNTTWKTTNEIATDKESKKTIIYCESGQERSSLVTAYTSKGIDVAVLTSPIDHPLMTKLEREDNFHFRRIDAAIDTTFIDASKEKTVLDASGRTEAAKIADFFRTAIGDQSLTIDAKSLDLQSLPAVMTLAEDERRFRDYLTRVSGQSHPVKPKASLIINTNSPLVQALYKAHTTSPKLANDIALHIWDLTRLSHKELTHDEIQAFTERSTHVLEQLIAASAKQPEKEKLAP